MSHQKKLTGSEPIERIVGLYEKNKKIINSSITIVLLAIGGYFGYKNFVQAPNNEKASIAMAYAEQMFSIDSVNMALNGDAQNAGFLKIIKKYDGTPSANIAQYFAGSCYLKLGDYNNAIKRLKNFDPKGTLLAHSKAGLLGDAYMELKDSKNAITYFKDASKDADDEVFTPLYLQRLAIAYEINNQPEEAVKCYKNIKDNFPNSYQSREVDKSLAMLGVLN